MGFCINGCLGKWVIEVMDKWVMRKWVGGEMKNRYLHSWVNQVKNKWIINL